MIFGQLPGRKDGEHHLETGPGVDAAPATTATSVARAFGVGSIKQPPSEQSYAI